MDNHKHLLHRRGYLHLLALFACMLLLGACQHTPSPAVLPPTGTPLPVATRTATPTQTFTFTPTPTETATVTPTPTPVVRAEPWERNRGDQDRTLAQLMFPFIGGVNHINRNGIDMRYGDLNIAIVGGSPIDPPQDIQALRETYAGQLNQDPELLEQLASIQQQLEGTANITVVIEDGEITQVAAKPYQTITRYVLENGILREMTAEEEPQLLPELYVDGTEFKREDTGEVVKLTGAVADHFTFGGYNLSHFKKSVDVLKDELGGNFVSIQWNSGFLNERYIDNLTQAAEYAKSKGLRVELVLSHRGLKPESTWNPIQILAPDNELINDWNRLLENRSIAERLNKAIDIFNPLSEPKFRNLNNESNSNTITWNEWLPIAENLANIIRQKLNNQNKIMAISGVNFGGDARGAIDYPPLILNFVIETHPYKWVYDDTGYKNYIDKLIKKNILVFCGEFGFEDTLNFKKNLLNLFNEKNISFAYYAIHTGGDNPNNIANRFGVTENGKIVKTFLTGEDETK